MTADNNTSANNNNNNDDAPANNNDAALRIDLEPAYRVDAQGRSSGHGKARMFFEGKLIGESRQPAFDAARYLLARGLATPSDRLTTYRNGRPCLFTVVGRAAKLTVTEDAKNGLRIVAYRELGEEALTARRRSARSTAFDEAAE